MTPATVRRIIGLAALACLLALTWTRSQPGSQIDAVVLHWESLPLPDAKVQQAHLGPFRLVGAWQLDTRSKDIGSFSSLLAPQPERFAAITDNGVGLSFTPPDAAPTAKAKRPRRLRLIHENGLRKEDRDMEGATRDPATGQVWVAVENANRIMRFDEHWKLDADAHPHALASWNDNQGAESFVRLADGRFLALREALDGQLEERRHEGVIWPGDPTQGTPGYPFTMEGPAGFKPTDAVQLPDGRVLVLFRKLLWPMPQRFAGRIVIGDPSRIAPGRTWRLTEVARIASSLPIDNFEGIAVVPAAEGKLAVWLISDDNFSNFQRTLLWKLMVDPRDLPR